MGIWKYGNMEIRKYGNMEIVKRFVIVISESNFYWSFHQTIPDITNYDSCK